MWRGQAEQKGGYYAALKDAYTSDKDDIAANKLKTTFTHATLNDLVCEWSRPESPHFVLSGPSTSC
jgi:hypothetical protein